MKAYKFNATIQPTDHGHGFVFFPYDTRQEFGTRGQVRVNATFDGAPYAGALVKYGAPQHMLPVVKAILVQIEKQPGDTVSVVLERDESVRIVEVPPEFDRAMKQAGVLAIFEKLSFTHRKEYSRWITDAKKEETRQNRIAKAVQMLAQGVKTPG
jgi:Bacteriocin-protection, YdeI or OmpD-Associated/Domain of unknown function (DUF1905)